MLRRSMNISAVFNFPREKWVLIFKVLIFNAVTSLLILGILAVLDKFDGLWQYARVYNLAAYFNSFSFFNFLVFFKRHCIIVPIVEEMFYRLPVFLLAAWEIKWTVGSKDITKYVLWIFLIIPTAFWALNHYPFPLPIFIAGLAYGWLIIKTKPSWPWPAIVCHSLSNLSIYIFVKILQLLEYASINQISLNPSVSY